MNCNGNPITMTYHCSYSSGHFQFRLLIYVIVIVTVIWGLPCLPFFFFFNKSVHYKSNNITVLHNSLPFKCSLVRHGCHITVVLFLKYSLITITNFYSAWFKMCVNLNFYSLPICRSCWQVRSDKGPMGGERKRKSAFGDGKLRGAHLPSP